MAFENLVGNEEVKKLLVSMVEQRKITHGYLFVGPSGIGKTLFAKEFAKRLLKVDNLESSPDFKYITKREDKKDILVEQIRKDVIDDIYISPVSGKRKVYIKCMEDIDFTISYMLDYFEYILYSKNKYSTVKYVENAKVRLKFNGNYDIIMDNMLFKIIDNI